VNHSKLVVMASLSPIQSAIQVDGVGDTMQIKLDIPLKTSPEALYIQTMTRKRLRVTIEVLEDFDAHKKAIVKPVKSVLYRKKEQDGKANKQTKDVH